MVKLSAKNLYSRFKKYIASNDLIRAGDKVIVACSGGPDSVALLYLLHRIAGEQDIKIIVAHYNHKLRGGEADADEKFVKNLAKKLKYKFVSGTSKGNINNEEQAREQRYAFLEKARGEEGAKLVAVGHTLDDLAETLLLNLIRGAGIRGLYSLKAKRGNIVRPLLFFEKSEVLTYLKEKKIHFRTDKSNKSLVYTRNIMRHKILPELKQINPKAATALARASLLASQADEYIILSSEKALTQIAENEGGKIIIERKKFTSLSPAIQSEILRLLARNAGVSRDLSFAQIDEILGMIKKNIGKKHKILLSRLKFEVKNGKIISTTLNKVHRNNTEI